MVAAKDIARLTESKNKPMADFVKTGTLTGHTRNPNRLNVALTRAKDGLVVVCQERLLCANPFSKKGKYLNSLMNMVTNARQRSLTYSVTEFEDLHPDAGATIRMKGEGRVRQLRTELDKSDSKYGFIEQAKKASAQLRKQKSARAIDVPECRTLQGLTTRPLLVGDRDTANAHDQDVREEKKKQGAQEAFRKTRNQAAEQALLTGAQIENTRGLLGPGKPASEVKGKRTLTRV